MPKKAIALGAIIIAVIIVGVYFSTKPAAAPSVAVNVPATSITGVVQSVAQSARAISVTTNAGLSVTIAIDDSTTIRNAAGVVIDITQIVPGLEVTAIGTSSNSTSLLASSILISKPTNTAMVQPDNLFENSLLPTSYSITGMADSSWYFEASFPVKILDGNGKLIYQTHATAGSDWTKPDLVPFTAWLSFDPASTATGTVVFEKDNPSGLPEHAGEVRVPIRFATQADTTTVKLYYPNSRKASTTDVCSTDTILPVERRIAKTDAPLQQTIKLLLAGVLTDEEKTQGFTTQFPNDQFKLLSTNLKDGTLTLEFSEVPGFTSGGSCNVTLLRAEITKTALQFANVKQVIFKPDTLFQP